MKNALWVSAVLIVVAFAALASATAADSGLRNTDVKRTITLWSSIAKHEMTINIANEGKSAESVYDLAIKEETIGKLALLTVSDNNAKVLEVKPVEQGRTITTSSGDLVAKATLYRATLAKPLGPGETMTLRVVMAFGHMLQPFPESITQAESQLVRFNDTHYMFSPYPTAKCTTTVKLASSSIQSSSRVQPMKIDGDTITYGPYTNISPYSLSPLYIHFEHTNPFLTAPKIVRDIEVSHWGNVAAEDMAVWLHTGAKLKGGFSRYTYQMTNAQLAALRALEITLPDGAADVYYKDAVGNISTSNWNKRRLLIEPRYPLFGGWQTSFCTGYNLPIDKYVSVSKTVANRYTLTVPVGPAYGIDVFVEKHTVKITLPEGATDIKVVTPFPMQQSMESKTTYLDTSGRPVVVLTASNLINEQLSKNIKISYLFTSTDLMREPAMLIAGTFAAFVIVILASHLSLDIMPEDPNVKEEKIKFVASETKRYIELLEKRLKACSVLDLEAQSATSNFQKHRQAAKDQIDASTSAVIRIIKDLESLDTNTAETIREIETLLKSKLEAQAAYHSALQSKKPVDSLKAAYVNADEEIEGLRKTLA